MDDERGPTGRPQTIWSPGPAAFERSAIARFARRNGLPVDQTAVWEWSVREPAAFWTAVWDACEVLGERGDPAVVDFDRMPGARFFPNARLSFAENLLRRRDQGCALIARADDGRRREGSFADLRDAALRARAALTAAGVGPGDRVASLLPNVPEAIAAMLGAAAVGAVWSSCSPDFGDAGVLDRFQQIAPKLLLVPDAHVFKGRRHDGLARVAGLRAGLPSVETVVVVPCAGPAGGHPPRRDDRALVAWSTFVDREPDTSALPRFAFDHPLYVLFSSGTTGRPKCIVHGQGGTLLQHLKEHRLHLDLREGDRFFYFTTTGWMMWNWLVTGLASGATLVLYDGSPSWPAADALWRMAADEHIRVFGTSAKYLEACRTQLLAPARDHDLSAIATILSTGSPLAPETFDYVHEQVAPHAQIASISGGTDIVSCFALGSPILPVRRGELQCRGLGMKVEVFDPSGRALVDEPGELVCTAPFPSMPTGFWDDPDGARYRAAYFEHYPGAWRHGDWCTLTADGGLRITGRSDSTLNPGGVRIGTAEIYRQVGTLDEVVDSVVVGQDDGHGDQRIVLFVVLRDGLRLDDALRARIRARIRQNLTPRHVPAVVAAVPDVPRTRSGKVAELAVRAVIHGRAVDNLEALANPECLERFRDRAELAP